MSLKITYTEGIRDYEYNIHSNSFDELEMAEIENFIKFVSGSWDRSQELEMQLKLKDKDE